MFRRPTDEGLAPIWAEKVDARLGRGAEDLVLLPRSMTRVVAPLGGDSNSVLNARTWVQQEPRHPPFYPCYLLFLLIESTEGGISCSRSLTM